METTLLILNCALTVGVLAYLLLQRGSGASAQSAQDAAAAAAAHTAELAAVEARLRDELRRTEGATREAANALRDEQRKASTLLRTELDAKLATQLETTLGRLDAIRQALDVQIAKLNTDNQKKLDEMRGVVDEKLQATLQTRLGEAFKQVSERLEQVHKGLGEMQSLAGEVGGLKRVMAGVKTRGILGEVQLESILEQFLTPDQVARNVETSPGSGKRVEFAVRMPGSRDAGPLWLPIDAKYPKEDYERLLQAQDQADRDAAEAAAAGLESSMVLFAKSIREKYVHPPHTTDFALLFVPTEGLYAEVLRRPGLAARLQTDHHVVVAGPTTLAALLQSLQMGFRTLALERRSTEVWDLLGAVKTEFGKFAETLDKARNYLEQASKTIDTTGTRTRAIERKLRQVQELPSEQASLLLPPEE